MIFEDSSHYYSNFQHSLDSPDLRPISLPMSGQDKSVDGMINLQTPGISFPGSDPFPQYSQSQYIPQMIDQYAINGPYQEAEPDYYSDSDYFHSADFEVKAAAPVNVVNQITHTIQNTDNQSVSRKRKASPSDEYIQSQPQKKTLVSHVQVRDADGDQYDSNQSSPYSSFVPVVSSKRNASPSFDYAHPQPQKRTVLSHVQIRDIESDQYDLNQPSPYSSYVPVPTTHTANNSPRPTHHYSTSNASQVSLAAPSPRTPAWSPSHTTVKTEQSPRAPMTPVPRPSSTSASYNASNPRLVRTSTIPQQGSPSLGPGIAAGMNTHTFNPYAMYPQHKATLRLIGDLDNVATDWSEEELQARRKLVVFTRSQTGSVIDAEFSVVPQEDWQRNSITVNCIWWKERKEAFVTSVDTIALLEQLVAVRFTVEEKNRIRRNLEGFRPLTVSKAKADSEDFFKTIMGFPNPKPRNIEKDVKVFPWKILAHALKKIISKYSASYSSTASTLATPAASVYASTETSTEYHLAPSPGHEMMSNGMPPVTMAATAYNAHMMSGRSHAAVTSGTPDMSLQVQVPSMPHAYEHVNPYQYEAVPMAPYHMHVPQYALTAPIHRPQPNWNFDQFVTPETSAHMQSASAPVSAYPHGHSELAEFYIPQAYQQRYHHRSG